MRERRPAKNYPPLLIAATATFALLAVLPSSLSQPLTNPAETLEYAPVPPDGRSDRPPAGSLSSLGLGGSASFGLSSGGDSDVGAGLDEVPGGRVVKTASTKRCVGNPPRQTEDPLSPPCVASYSGDNGGATYQGVTRDEVRVLFAGNGGTLNIGSSRNPAEEDPVNRYYDLAEPPPDEEADEPILVRALRVWQRYFNERYQTYGRFVHFYLHYGEGPEGSREQSRAQAAENYARIRPFAAHSFAGDRDAYHQVMLGKGVHVFSDLGLASADTFSKFAGLYWNYSPSLELQARMFVSHVCAKVIPQPASDSGNPGENGGPRRLGLIHNEGGTDPNVLRFKTLIQQGIEACGGRFLATGTYPCDCYQQSDASYAPPVMAEFKEKGITTVIWAGGGENNFSAAARALAYFPEWVIAGTGLAEGTLNGQSQDPDVWDHAWVVTTLPLLEISGVTKACEEAYAEADGFDHPWERNSACSALYNSVRQLFTGIQVAGPQLNRDNLDKGYHAIPPQKSPRPDLPACFYDLGDYTCVKDATVMWWDSSAQGSTGPGCWRMSEDGQRYGAGRWPQGNLDTQRQPDDICNNRAGGGKLQ